MEQNATILILDDDPEFLNQLAAVLSDAGFGVVTAHDVEGVEDLLFRKALRIDVFVVDLVLPGTLSGFDVIAAVTRKAHPFKIIAASCVFRDSILEYISKRLGIDGFVEKTKRGEPFNADQWLRTLKRIIDGQALAGYSSHPDRLNQRTPPN